MEGMVRSWAPRTAPPICLLLVGHSRPVGNYDPNHRSSGPHRSQMAQWCGWAHLIGWNLDLTSREKWDRTRLGCLGIEAFPCIHQLLSYSSTGNPSCAQIISSGRPSMITHSKRSLSPLTPCPNFSLHLYSPAILSCIVQTCLTHVLTTRADSEPFSTRSQAKDPHRAKFPHRGGVSTWGCDSLPRLVSP